MQILVHILYRTWIIKTPKNLEDIELKKLMSDYGT